MTSVIEPFEAGKRDQTIPSDFSREQFMDIVVGLVSKGFLEIEDSRLPRPKMTGGENGLDSAATGF